jgi:hypothetical protein
MLHREAVRQRKALSRTSSNILLNSVHLHNQSSSLNPHHLTNNHLRTSDCDLESTNKDIQLDTHSELSDLDVSNIPIVIRQKFYIKITVHRS